MEEPKIEKGIPLKERGNMKSRMAFLRKLEIGDSFLVDSAMEANKYRNNFGSLAPKCFRSRQVEGGIQIWRVEDKLNGTTN